MAHANERGEYRAIRRVLLDGPHFQALSRDARWVFVALKLNVGASGIDVQYPDALVAMLSAQTGCGPDDVRAALDELEEHGWLRREANVVWLVGHLANDPNIKSSDPKHRKGVQRHVSGLPRLAIVRAFVAAHPDFFPPSEGPSMGLAWAFEGPSKQEEGRRERKKGVTTSSLRSDGAADADAGGTPERVRGAVAPPPTDQPAVQAPAMGGGGEAAPKRPRGEPAPWMGAMAEVWRTAYGGFLPPGSATLLRPVVAEYGAEQTALMLAAYCAQTPAQFASLRTFVAKAGSYAEDADTGKGLNVDPETGLLTERGARVLAGGQ
jgi:hypothetical protein